MIRVVSKHSASAAVRQSLAAQLNKTGTVDKSEGLWQWRGTKVTYTHGFFFTKRRALFSTPTVSFLIFVLLSDVTGKANVWNFSCYLQKREGVKVRCTCQLKSELTQFKNNTVISFSTNVPRPTQLWQDVQMYKVDWDEFRVGVKNNPTTIT
jgi:hypothetical protein